MSPNEYNEMIEKLRFQSNYSDTNNNNRNITLNNNNNEKDTENFKEEQYEPMDVETSKL